MRMASLGYSPHEETNSRGKNRSAQWGASWRCDVTNLGSWIMLRHCLQTPMQFNKVFTGRLRNTCSIKSLGRRLIMHSNFFRLFDLAFSDTMLRT
ncbi:Os09g0517825, partial [Oryza sativa Japonica Group]